MFFEKVYGAIGKKYIHVHHVIPLSEIRKEYALDPVKDLVPVCPNCHAIIHRTQPPLTVKQLKEHLESNANYT
jgi:5-methylcytosine-specific restriction protein A